MAWAHAQLRNDPAAVFHLQGMENVAPELLSFNGSAPE